MKNRDAPWEKFNPDVYWDNNYKAIRPDDLVILQILGRTWSKHFATGGSASRRGIDLGSGSNLYPLLAMLPWVTDATLVDCSLENRKWLRREISEPRTPWLWQPFWETLGEGPVYGAVDDPRTRLESMSEAGRIDICDIDIFDLPRHSWDIGTMFFVAESITSSKAEFDTVVGSFLRAMRPGSPFAAGFITGSRRYPVDGVTFPAANVSAPEVEQRLVTAAIDVERHEIPRALDHPLRDHQSDEYDQMVLFTGCVA